MSDSFKEALFSAARHALTAGGGALLVAKGWLSHSQLETAVAAVMVLIGLGWGVWDEYRAAQKKPTEETP